MISHYFRAKFLGTMKGEEKLRAGTWVHVESPTTDEIDKLVTDYGVDKGALADALDPFEVPRSFQESGWVYIYVRTPVDLNNKLGPASVPICIMFGSEYIATISQEPIQNLVDTIKNSDVLTTQKMRLVVCILSEILKEYERNIAQINKDLRKYALTDESTGDDDVVTMLAYERVVNEYLDSLIPMSTIIANIQLGKMLTLFKQDIELLEDIRLTAEQLVGWSKATLRTIQNTREAYSTVLTGKLNKNIHQLTMITIALSIPTMLAGLFGMNVALPFQESKSAFVMITVFSAMCALLIYVLFSIRHKH